MNTSFLFPEYLSIRESALNSMRKFSQMKWVDKALLSPETVDIHECALFITDCVHMAPMIDFDFLAAYMNFVNTVIVISPEDSPELSDVKTLHKQVFFCYLFHV